jgi:hypothetical protein
MNGALDLSGFPDPLLRTNPVWCLDLAIDSWRATPLGWIRAPGRLHAALRCLTEQGVAVPQSASGRWAEALGLSSLPSTREPEPGVVGLLFDEGGLRSRGSAPRGFVTPLTARAAEGWDVPKHFPFQAAHLQDLLLRLVAASTLSLDRAVPERLAFEIGDRLGQRAEGSSMHVAGLLAVLDTVAGRPALLRGACAVVMPEGEELIPVGFIREKLEAFRREYGRGTLLVWHPDSKEEVTEFLPCFHQSWSVRSLAELAGRAEEVSGRVRLLSPLLKHVELSHTDLSVAHHYLVGLIDREHRYSPAYDLSRRLLQCGRQPEVPVPLVRAVERRALDLARHLGYLEESEQLARRQVERLRQTTCTSYDERAEADVIHAASLYHLHRFEAIVDRLEPWRRQIHQDPLRFTPETRVKLFNTLARAQIALDREGWQELIEESVAILEDRDPNDRPRALCILAHGLLHRGDLSRAREVLDRAGGLPGSGPFPRWTRAFLEADLARREGRRFTDPEMEKAAPRGQFGLPLGSYLQATARQHDCPDPAGRFARAAEAFRRDAGPPAPTNLLHCLASLMDLAAAAWRQPADLDGWSAALVRLHEHLRPREGFGLAEYYHEPFKRIGDHPEPAAVESMLCRVPHF